MGDAYGPFWIATTLLFSIAVSANISSYVHFIGGDVGWEYDFQVVLTCASLVYGFALFIPLIMWVAGKQIENLTFPFPLALCLYGYSLFSFIPASILCLVPSEIVSWLSLMTAFLFSS